VQTVPAVWSKRSMIIAFAFNELKKRYKDSVLGFAWTFLEPLFMLSVLVTIFSALYRSNPIPHFVLYVLLNVIMWTYFTRATTAGMNSITGRGRMTAQIYFPREILPLSSCISSSIILIFELGIFFAFVAAFHFIPTLMLALLPLALTLEFFLIIGVSLALSVLNIYYRDVRHIWGVITYAGFFLTPIFYTLDRLPDNIRSLELLNPLAQLIQMSHNAVLFNQLPAFNDFIYTITIVPIFLGIGILIFRKLEPRIAEEI
jgi:lipopolysaccharide transport system permease protein